MHRFALVVTLGLSCALSGCGARGDSSATASPSPVGASTAQTSPIDSGAPTSEATALAGATATPVVVPTSTPDPNLLTNANGTIVRSYSPAALDRMNDGSPAHAATGIGAELPSDAAPPFVFTFELPGTATISVFQAALRAKDDKGPAPAVTFAVSTTGADSGFADVGTITAGDSGNGAKTLQAGKQARWVRVTANQLFDSVGATGTLAAPSKPLDPTGIFIEEARPDKNGAFAMSGTIADDFRARFVVAGPSLIATECTKDRLIATQVGQFDGRTWTSVFAGNKDENPSKIRAVMNDEGTIIAGTLGNNSDTVVFMRTSEKTAFCVPRVIGTGTHHVLVLDQDPIEPFYPTDGPAPVSGYTFESIGAGMLDAAALAGKDAVIARSVCKVPELLAPQQIALLLQWVAAGHKLVLGAGGCPNGADFSWLPYPLTTAGPGPETPNASLIQVENDALGTNDKNDAAHFVDVLPYVGAGNFLRTAGRGDDEGSALVRPPVCGEGEQRQRLRPDVCNRRSWPADL